MRWVTCLVIVLMLLSGCARTAPEVDPVGEGFSCAFDATYQDLHIKGTVTRKSAGTLTLSFAEPATLSGLTAVWDGENITFSLHGLQFSVDPSAVPESALGQELIAALDAVQRGEGERVCQDGNALLKGQGNHGEYTLRYDTATGLPMALSVPALPLEITFSHDQ